MIEQRKHAHYFKDVRHLDELDVYRVLDLWRITDPCIGHALKKLLVPGGRGAGKDISKDVQEAIDSLLRWQVMQAENAAVPAVLGAERREPCACGINCKGPTAGQFCGRNRA